MSVYRRRRRQDPNLQEDKAKWFGNGKEDNDQDGFEIRIIPGKAMMPQRNPKMVRSLEDLSTKGQTKLKKFMSKLMRRRRQDPNLQEDKAKWFGNGKEDNDQDGFEIRIIPGKGRAVFATRFFEKGNFLLVYGELITEKEANEREQRDRKNVPIYRYFFRLNSKNFW
ncbi:Hypothetical predicted protein [Paramuricea clavata]|uniref:SET domain-containing protein n=1 Tax=Paramuricea clavata TaxID=317549 RepID=A0A6S7I3K1_PARCT|nr:Hypothetical predicted protein [Paramuricea clavata]